MEKRNNTDLTGQKFNRLTVLKKVTRPKSKNSYWQCQCDCGNIVEVRRDCLTTGKIKSCGCYRSDIKAVDLINKRFGKLIALEPTEDRKKKRIIWKCKCDCGNICYIDTSNLQSGRVGSCGCLHSSKGEYLIEQLLKENNIPYEKEKTFDTCRFPDTNYLARFDFYVNNKYLIEFDGEQHFKNRNFFGGEKEFIKRKEHDEFKNQWCKENNIPLIRIPYTKLKNLTINDLVI